MNFKKTPILLILIVLLTSCASLFNDLKSYEYYTQVNMWEYKSFVSSVNYSVSRKIPVNTKIEIGRVTRRSITFYLSVAPNHKITIENNRDYTGLSTKELFKRYFSKNTVDLNQFNKKEVMFIKEFNGFYAKDISKEALLIARGYPPVHRTKSLEFDTWIYWRNKWKTRSITFVNGKTSKLSGRELE